jgi:hypothetical protein
VARRQHERASRRRSADPEWRRGADQHAGGHFGLVTAVLVCWQVDFAIRKIFVPRSAGMLRKKANEGVVDIDCLCRRWATRLGFQAF